MRSCVHGALDVLSYGLLLTTVTYVATVHDARMRVAFQTIVAQHAVGWLRWLEVALVAKREHERRHAGAKVVDGLPALLLLVGSLLAMLDARVESRPLDVAASRSLSTRRSTTSAAVGPSSCRARWSPRSSRAGSRARRRCSGASPRVVLRRKPAPAGYPRVVL